jgi:DNA polymerase V
LRRQFSVVLEKTVLELRGTSCLDGDDAPAANEQIMCSRSFGNAVTELPELIEVVSQFASRVAEKARHQQSVARAVHVFIATSPFRKHDRQHSASVTTPLIRPTADTRLLIGAAVHALDGIYRPGFNYVKAGVMLVDLQAEGHEQEELDLFAAAGEQQRSASGRDPKLMNAVDSLNKRFGRGAISVASAAPPAGGEGAHTAKQERRSPRFTTRLTEIPLALA